MKGIVLNLLEEVVRRQHGEAAWDAILDAAHLDGIYTTLGSYPDGDLGRLVAAASAALGVPPEAVVRWFGSQALPLFAERYPQLFAAHRTTRSFLLALNDIIHPEVRKLYPGADVPLFDYETSSDDVLVLGYRSVRKLCAFAQGLTEGAAAYYGETIRFEHLACMHNGDPRCVFHISFEAPRA
jgi:hypothetical protein